jgi:hypothetical protein
MVCWRRRALTRPTKLSGTPDDCRGDDKPAPQSFRLCPVTVDLPLQEHVTEEKDASPYVDVLPSPPIAFAYLWEC